MSEIQPIRWSNNTLHLLDQRLLPHRETTIELTSAEESAEAIRDMVVRGAPAIGITAAYGVALAAARVAEESSPQCIDEWQQQLAPAIEALAESRPTAVNLFWALERAKQVIVEGDDVPARLLALAHTTLQEDIANNRLIGDFGAGAIAEPCAVYTHCNAGALATGGYGTALGVIRSAFRDGKISHVYAGETRPWLQGARLTAWELCQEQIPHSLSCEGAAGQLLRQGHIGWVIVGADRVAANGDVANKVGTYNLAVLARYHGVKLMVAAPTSTLDMQTENGDAIPIEQRSAEEVLQLGEHRLAPKQSGAINPSFDVTPADLVDALVTERGVIFQPNREKLSALMDQS